jgi:uncharacterized damage-inducible protein DinB
MEQLARLIGRELGGELTEAFDRIRHCLAQLTDEQVWRRPREEMNSIGNLLLHLAGNVRQWIIAGLGGLPDTRNRPGEFSERRLIARQDLLAWLEATVEEAKRMLDAVSSEDWMRRRHIQGFEVTGLGAAISSVAHFRGHTQEIIHMTRAILGERYRFAWTPASPDQWAES